MGIGVEIEEATHSKRQRRIKRQLLPTAIRLVDHNRFTQLDAVIEMFPEDYGRHVPARGSRVTSYKRLLIPIEEVEVGHRSDIYDRVFGRIVPVERKALREA